MKKLTFLFVCMLVTMCAVAQKSAITFKEKEHDFGKIQEKDGNASYVFEFTNTGDAPLVINRVQASCGCTTPTWTKEPVEAGKKGQITVTYSTANRPGMFTKSISTYTNGTTDPTILIIKGEVIPKPAEAPKTANTEKK